MKGEGSASIQGFQSSAAIAIAALLSTLFLLTTAPSAHAAIISSQLDHSVDTRYFEFGGPDCIQLATTSSRSLGNLTLYFGTNSFANIAPPGPHWITLVTLSSSTNCSSSNLGVVTYKDSYIPTEDNTVHTFDASLGFWTGYGGYGSQATATSAPSLVGVQSIAFIVARATVPTFSSNGMYPCWGYCVGYLQGDGTTSAHILEDDGPTATTTPICTENCNSNVLFLPGIEASQLFAPGLFGEENTIWLPNSLVGLDVWSLDMNNHWTADAVYTREKAVVKRAYLAYDVYDSFVTMMDKMRDNDHLIDDWSPIAYDWRLDYEDLLSHGNVVDGKIYYRGFNSATSTPYIVQELKRLAAGSRTGKVTIIAHSNGGLLAKALLSHPEYAVYVDKVILVATPQLGTPQAIGGLLHGFDQSLPSSLAPLVLNAADARYLGNSMPMTYNLLPSSQYFSHISNKVADFDLITLPEWVGKYGAAIDSKEGLDAFLTDASRPIPYQSSDYSDTVIPIVASSTLLANATQVHNTLDDWTPPAGIQFITIAGWGNDTVSGISYRKLPLLQCSFVHMLYLVVPQDCSETTHLSYDPLFVIDGDGTVIDASAQWDKGGESTKYWIDLNMYNQVFGIALPNTLRTGHANLLSVVQINELISDIITAPTVTNLPQFISTSQPVYSGTEPRIILVAHSPVTLGFMGLDNTYTGSTATSTSFGVPGVDYQRFGEVQWLSIPKSLAGTVIMQGTGNGSFTLDIQERNGNSITATTSFVAIPSSTSTTATLSIDPAASPVANGILSLDFDSDEQSDLEFKAQSGDAVSFHPLTVRANDQEMILGGVLPELTASIEGFSTNMLNDVVGSPLCTTTATSISPVGTYPITCTIGSLQSSNYQFVSFVAGTLTIKYRWDGFLQPINDTAHQTGQGLSVFKAGSTVPVKFQLKSIGGGLIQASSTPLWITPQKGSAMSASVDESIYSDPATTGNIFKWDPESQRYIYNWHTKGLSSGYWYKVFVRLDDGTIQSVVIGLK